MKVHGEGLTEEDMKTDTSDQSSDESELDESDDEICATSSTVRRNQLMKNLVDMDADDDMVAIKKEANRALNGAPARRRLKNNKRMSLNSDGERDDDMNDEEEEEEDYDEQETTKAAVAAAANNYTVGGDPIRQGYEHGNNSHIEDDGLNIKRNYSPEQSHTGGRRPYRRPNSGSAASNGGATKGTVVAPAKSQKRQKLAVLNEEQQINGNSMIIKAKSGRRQQCGAQNADASIPTSTTTSNHDDSKLLSSADYSASSPTSNLLNAHQNHLQQTNQPQSLTTTAIDNANGGNYYSLTGYARQYHNHYASAAAVAHQQQQLSHGPQTNQYGRGLHQQHYASQSTIPHREAAAVSGHESVALANSHPRHASLLHANACNQQQQQLSRSPTCGPQSKTTAANGASPTSTATTLSDW